MHLPDVGSDALFRKSYIACLISYVFNEQQGPLSPVLDYQLLQWVTCRTLLSREGEVLLCKGWVRATHPQVVQVLQRCAGAGILHHSEHCSAGHL